MRLKSFAPLIVVAMAAIVLWAVIPWPALMAWVTDAQRAFQDRMAVGLNAVRLGDMSYVWALCGATAAYGFVHALGPGHGKVLLGGAALASGATLRRMTALTVISSLAQAGTAIVLVGILAAVFGLTSQQLGPIADNWLAPASYAAIALLGGYLVWRGMRHWRSAQAAQGSGHHHHHDDHHHDHHHDHGHHHHDHHHHDGETCGCGHAHGPSVKEVEALSTFREAAVLVGSIAMRPCTGAIFVLVIALRFDVFWVGCLAVVTMGLGTAAFNLLVAGSGVAARQLSMANLRAGDSIARVSACVQMLGGGVILLFSVLWLLRFWG